jgi:hypothetical protein
MDKVLPSSRLWFRNGFRFGASRDCIPSREKDVAMPSQSVRLPIVALVVGLAPLLLTACATPQELVQAKEDRLLAAGFVARPANTPDRQAMMQRLPAHTFEMRQMN